MRQDVTILKGVVSKDHIHMHIEYRPSQSVSGLIRELAKKMDFPISQKVINIKKDRPVTELYDIGAVPIEYRIGRAVYPLCFDSTLSGLGNWWQRLSQLRRVIRLELRVFKIFINYGQFHRRSLKNRLELSRTLASKG